MINNICDTCLLIGASNHMTSITPSVVEDARKLVEGSLTDTEAHSVKDPGSGYDSRSMTDFSENLQTDDAAGRANDFADRMVDDGYELDTSPPEASVPWKKNKNIVIILMVAILLIAAVAVLSKIFAKEYDIFPFYSSKKMAAPERPPIPGEKK